MERAVIIRSERLGRTSLADVEETLRLLDQVLADNAREMENCEPEFALGGNSVLSVHEKILTYSD